MNFLSHFYTSYESIDPYKLLGIILPDLAKDFSKIYNQKIEGKYFPKDKNLKAILSGVEMHILGDDLFHHHGIFLNLETYAKQVLTNKKDLIVKRKYVIAHVLVELMIDQYILNLDNQIAKNFYNKLSLVNLDQANQFFEEILVQEEESHFKNNFTFFRERAFIYRLQENEGIIFTLEKVFGRLFDAKIGIQAALWEEVIETIKLKLNQDVPALLQDLKIKLNAH